MNDKGSVECADKEVEELKNLVKKETLLRKAAEEEVSNLRTQVAQLKRSEVCFGMPHLSHSLHKAFNGGFYVLDILQFGNL